MFVWGTWSEWHLHHGGYFVFVHDVKLLSSCGIFLFRSRFLGVQGNEVNMYFLSTSKPSFQFKALAGAYRSPSFHQFKKRPVCTQPILSYQRLHIMCMRQLTLSNVFLSNTKDTNNTVYRKTNTNSSLVCVSFIAIGKYHVDCNFRNQCRYFQGRTVYNSVANYLVSVEYFLCDRFFSSFSFLARLQQSISHVVVSFRKSYLYFIFCFFLLASPSFHSVSESGNFIDLANSGFYDNIVSTNYFVSQLLNPFYIYFIARISHCFPAPS